FSSRRRHTRSKRDWSSDVCSSDLVEVNRKLPWTLEIQIEEYDRVGYIKKEGLFYPVMGNGKTLTAEQKTMHGDAPLIMDFTDDTYLQRITKELEKLPEGIFNLISEVHWKPTEENKNKIMLYMNDGFKILKKKVCFILLWGMVKR